MTPTDDRDHWAYRGYSLDRNPFTREWIVRKGGVSITLAPTLSAAQAAVDAILSPWPPLRQI